MKQSLSQLSFKNRLTHMAANGVSADLGDSSHHAISNNQTSMFKQRGTSLGIKKQLLQNSMASED